MHTTLKMIAKIIDPSIKRVLVCPVLRVKPSGQIKVTAKKIRKEWKMALQADFQKVLLSY